MPIDEQERQAGATPKPDGTGAAAEAEGIGSPAAAEASAGADHPVAQPDHPVAQPDHPVAQPDPTAARGDVPAPPTATPWAPLRDRRTPEAPARVPAPRRVRPRRLVAVIVAAALVVVAALVGATYTSVFAADAIRVRGNHHLTKGEVLRLSGLERGVNVFHLDGDAIETSVERDPWVARATVTKELPRTVILTIRERVPVAVVNDGTVERLVAGDGGLLGVGAPPNLPRIVAEEGATTTDPAAVRAAAGAVAAMRADVRRQIAFVRLLPEGDLALELRSGVPVAYGSAEEPVSKAQALAAMLRYVERTGERFTSIDVSEPTAPAGTLVGG